jgi:hypothetical protein
MENQPSEERVGKPIPEAVYELPVTDLNLPLNTISLLGNGGFATVGELMQRLQEDRESLLLINGIGPKTLAGIELAVSEFDLAERTLTYPEPIPSLGDHYKVAPQAEVTTGPAVEEVIEKDEKEEEVAGKKKSKKKDKKMTKAKSKKKNPSKKKKKGKKKKKK